jgi:hypothetical protein
MINLKTKYNWQDDPNNLLNQIAPCLGCKQDFRAYELAGQCCKNCLHKFECETKECRCYCHD